MEAEFELLQKLYEHEKAEKLALRDVIESLLMDLRTSMYEKYGSITGLKDYINNPLCSKQCLENTNFYNDNYLIKYMDEVSFLKKQNKILSLENAYLQQRNVVVNCNGKGTDYAKFSIEIFKDAKEKLKQKIEEVDTLNNKITKLKTENINLKSTINRNNLKIMKMEEKLNCIDDNCTNLRIRLEEALNAQIPYKEILDDIVGKQIGSNNIIESIKAKFDEKIKQLKSEKQEDKRTENVDDSQNRTLSHFKNPCSEVVKELQQDLNDAYLYNKSLLRILKSKMRSCKRGSDEADFDKNLLTIKKYCEMRKEYKDNKMLADRLEKNFERVLKQLRNDILQIMGFEIELNSDDDNSIKLTSLFANDKTEFIIFRMKAK